MFGIMKKSSEKIYNIRGILAADYRTLLEGEEVSVTSLPGGQLVVRALNRPFDDDDSCWHTTPVRFADMTGRSVFSGKLLMTLRTRNSTIMVSVPDDKKLEAEAFISTVSRRVPKYQTA